MMSQNIFHTEGIVTGKIGDKKRGRIKDPPPIIPIYVRNDLKSQSDIVTC